MNLLSKGTSVRRNVTHLALVLTILMGIVPTGAVFANSSKESTSFTEQLFLPVMSTGRPSIPGTDSEEFKRFQQRIEQLMAEIEVEVDEDGNLHIDTDFPSFPEASNDGSVQAATLSEEAEFYSQISTLVELVNTGRLSFAEMSSANVSGIATEIQAAGVVAPDFEWYDDSSYFIFTLYENELTLIKWIAGETFGVFVGAVFGALFGGPTGAAVGGTLGWFAGNYLEDYIIEDFLPETFKFGVIKSEVDSLSRKHLFYINSYRSDSTHNCNGRWQQYLFELRWFGATITNTGDWCS